MPLPPDPSTPPAPRHGAPCGPLAFDTEQAADYRDLCDQETELLAALRSQVRVAANDVARLRTIRLGRKALEQIGQDQARQLEPLIPDPPRTSTVRLVPAPAQPLAPGEGTL